MSGIYIKGLKMPEKGKVLKVIISWYRNEGLCSVPIDIGKSDYYSVVPVPDHGDLIDRGKLPTYTGYALSADKVAKAVEDAPAVIPADIKQIVENMEQMSKVLGEHDETS